MVKDVSNTPISFGIISIQIPTRKTKYSYLQYSLVFTVPTVPTVFMVHTVLSSNVIIVQYSNQALYVVT